MGTYYREAQPASCSMPVVYSESTKKSGGNFRLDNGEGFTLLLFSFGCTKKEDDSHLESNAVSELNTQSQAEDSVQSNVEDPCVKGMLELWEAGQKEDAVKEFLAIRWEDPSAYREVPVFTMSDRQWRSLPRDEQLASTKDARREIGRLREVLLEVVSTGRTLVSSGNSEMAKEHFEAARRKNRPLRGKKDIALRVGKVIDRYKMAKHFKLTITHANFKYERQEEKIKAEAALDGFYVVRTSVSAQSLTPEATVSTYKRLSVVERAFRCLKTVDMKVRPIFHRLAKRVRAHIFLCTLAYYVEWEMRRLLAPILFDDEDHELAEQQRSSVVAPAQRSQTAKRKASSKHTADGVPVHSFRTLLKDLATITKNQIQPNLPDAPTFEKVTQPRRKRSICWG